MEVLHLCPRFFPAISGAEFYMQRISEELQKSRKVNIAFHCSNAIDFAGLRMSTKKNLPESSFCWHNLFTVHRHAVNPQNGESLLNWYSEKLSTIFKHTKENQIIPFLTNGPSIPTFFSSIERSKYSIIHATFFPYQTILDGLICGRLQNVPSVCTPFFHFANPRYQKIEEISLLNCYSKIIACTQMEKKELSNRGITSNKIEVIPMGVDAQKFELAEKEGFLESYHIEKNRPIVLFCGYKNFEKGALTLLHSLPLVKAHINNVLFCFIGPSTTGFNYELSRLKKQGLRDNILNIDPSNLGGYFDKKKLGAFKSCSLYAMPSRTDAYGISFLEAWASGKPVIGANIGATPEIIRDGIDGYLVDFDNPIALAEKIQYLLQNPELTITLGKNGQLKVREHNNWKAISQKIFEIYEVLVNEKNS